MRLGNGKFENTTFNSRLQPTQIGLGSSATSQNLIKLEFNYGGSDNNGNVKSQTITTPTVGTVTGFTAVQTYSYDSLNRLKDAKEMIGTAQQWKQTFTFDRYGNRTFDTANNNTTTLANGCPVNICNPTANPQDNKLVGTNYDSVGNTKIDANGQVFTYDAENKQTKVINAQGVTLGEYFYDGDGKRIKKIAPLTSETTIFVYDASGKMVAEYSTVSASQVDAKINYTTNDHLGSPRINTDAVGKVIARHDTMPFGEEIQRASYGSDNLRNRFTTYERDTETTEDFAQARYYNYKLGRFNSADEPFADQDETDPQTWNLYTYARSNPLKYSDPSGNEFEICYAGVPCQKVSDKVFNEFPSETRYTYHNGVITEAYTGEDGKQGTRQVGTFTRLSDDSLSDFQNGVLYGNKKDPGLTGRAPALMNFCTVGAAVAGCVIAAPVIGELVVSAVARRAAAALLQKTIQKVLSDPNKLNHIFKAKHLLAPIVTRLGGQREFVTAVLTQLSGTMSDGKFVRTIELLGSQVTVEGNVINGVIRIGTVYIKP